MAWRVVGFKLGLKPAQLYVRLSIISFCADTGYSLDDLLRAMVDRDGWWERVRAIHAWSVTSWYIYIYMCVCVCVCVYIYIQRNLGYRATFKPNNSEFDLKIWVKYASVFVLMFRVHVEPMKTENAQWTVEGNPTQPNGWTNLPWAALFLFSNKSVVEHNFVTNYVQQPRFTIYIYIYM